jgi:MEMO1 family protein
MSEPDPKSYPRLRAVEAFPVQVEGENYICLQDPQKLAENPVFLNQALVFLVSRMDGRRSLRDIQADFLKATGEVLPLENLEQLVSQLDEQRYLDSPQFRTFYQDLVRKFCDASSRPAQNAGSAYAAESQSLQMQIQSYFVHPEGPGSEIIDNSNRPLRGLVSPHIDFTRGGPTYAHAYSALASHPGADTFIIFGTCHTFMPKRFSIGSKDYETPLGPARVDQDFVARLSSRLNHEYSDEFPHRGEHSIEFQAVWLNYLFSGKRPFKIVPILIGSFQDIYRDGRAAGDDPEIQRVTSAIQETMKESQGHFCFVAGADLAHVGSRFGDAAGPTESYLQEVECEDRKFLGYVEKGDAEAVFQSIAADDDRRRVCGYPSIYMTLRCIENPEGKLLQYRQWADIAAGSAVTYASVALF